jgi:succinoglycan biosynthesis transport protein ExoP
MLQRSIEPRNQLVPGPQADQRGRREAETDAIVDILRCLKRNARMIVAIALSGTAIATAAVFSITPQYQATSAVLVDPRQTKILQDAEVVGRPGTDNGAIESEVELIQSDALVRKVAEKLNLKDDDEFGSSGGILSVIKSVILLPIRLLSNSEASGDPLSGVVDKLQKATSAKRRGLTYVIELNTWSRDAEKSAAIANTFVELYLAEQIAAKSEVTSRASRWLNERVDEMRVRVSASEKALETYKAEAGLFDGAAGENLSNRQLGQLNDQLIDARAKAASAHSKYEQLKQVTPERLRSAAASPDVLQSSVVSNLRGQYADQARQQAEREARYGPQHPIVATGRAQVADLERQISAEINRIVTSAKTEFEMAKASQESLETSLDELKEKAALYNQAGVKLRELERDVQANRDLFQSFLARAKQTSELSLQIADSRVVSPARVPSSTSYPRKGLIIGLGLFGSLGLGMALALGRDAFGRGFRRSADLEREIGLQSLASIPLVNLRSGSRSLMLPGMKSRQSEFGARSIPNSRNGDDAFDRLLADFALNQPDSSFSESVRTLYLSLKQQGLQRRMGVVLITSALPGEGKSTVALNLARTAAQTGEEVLLVDGDLRRPALAKAMHLSGDGGLTDFLAGNADLASVVKQDARTNLYAIAGRQGVPGARSIALLSSHRMTQLIDHARDVFDLVVIDASPLLPVADARILLDRADAVVMVVASERTSRDAVASVFRENPDLTEKVAGVVLNGVVDDFERYYSDPKRTFAEVNSQMERQTHE